ncbi:hypothetical protein D3C73_993620 [compost metagenome]
MNKTALPTDNGRSASQPLKAGIRPTSISRAAPTTRAERRSTLVFSRNPIEDANVPNGIRPKQPPITENRFVNSRERMYCLSSAFC